MKKKIIQTKRVCSVCNSINEPDSLFCTRCGLKIKEQISSNRINRLRLIKNNVLFSLLIILSFVNVICWYLIDANNIVLFNHYFTEVKTLLWISLHGRLIAGIILFITASTNLLFIHKPILFTFSKAVLIISGLWNITNDFLAIPALQEYNIYIGFDIVLNDLDIIWLIVGFLQLSLFSIMLFKNE